MVIFNESRMDGWKLMLFYPGQTEVRVSMRAKVNLNTGSNQGYEVLSPSPTTAGPGGARLHRKCTGEEERGLNVLLSEDPGALAMDLGSQLKISSSKRFPSGGAGRGWPPHWACSKQAG